MPYLTLITLQEKYYIRLTETSNKEYGIAACDTKEEVINQFKNFKDKVVSNSYENHISGSLGILNLRPHVIELSENPMQLEKYVLNTKPQGLKGGGFGFFIDMVGLEVSKDILELSILDICKSTIEEAYK